MADGIQAVPVPAGGLVLVLVGNIHPMKTQYAFGTQSFMPAAGQMPAGRVVSVDVQGNGGTAWNCQSDGCGAHDQGDPAFPTRGGNPAGPGNPRFHAIFALATKTTASPPAKGVDP